MEITQVADKTNDGSQVQDDLNQIWTIESSLDATSNTTTISLTGRLSVNMVEALYKKLKDSSVEDAFLIIDLTEIIEMDLSIVQLFYFLRETNKTSKEIDFQWKEHSAFVSLIERCGLNFFNKVNG